MFKEPLPDKSMHAILKLTEVATEKEKKKAKKSKCVKKDKTNMSVAAVLAPKKKKKG
jgi:hypothetical protein